MIQFELRARIAYVTINNLLTSRCVFSCRENDRELVRNQPTTLQGCVAVHMRTCDENPILGI